MIETARLELRPCAPTHLLALIEGEAEFETLFGLPPAAGLRGFFVSDEVSSEWLAMLRTEKLSDPWQHGFLVVHRESGTVVGTVGFKGAPDADGMVEIGYGIVPALEGRGLATEAAAAGVAFAFGDPAVRMVRAHTLPARNASTRVLEKCGFAFLGAVEDPEDGLVWRWEQRLPADA